MSMYHKYIDTVLNLEADTLKEALDNKTYVKNECWINTLYDYYKDDLLNLEKSKRYCITKAMILETIGKTEENIKQGVSVLEIQPFFEKHRLSVRIINELGKVIYKHNPDVSNHHRKI